MHLWNQLLNKTLMTLVYKQMLTDPNCFIKVDQHGTIAIMAVHVDDQVITARTKEIIRATINDLKKHF